jgi:hypothetical protein
VDKHLLGLTPIVKHVVGIIFVVPVVQLSLLIRFDFRFSSLLAVASGGR